MKIIMNLKVGAFSRTLRLVCCVLVLFPNCVLAASIPGFTGKFVPPVTIPAPALPSAPPKINVPGFYGSNVQSPPATQLPVLKQTSLTIPGVSIEDDPSQNKKTIHQSLEKVIIDWASFDIGADAWVHYDQQGNSNWAALNRIWDKNPSYIFGKLTADGKIYLINQNGILFGPGSKVNVNTLVASALNITDDNFLKDVFINKNRVLLFKLEDYQGTGLDTLATVSNQGDINAAGGGSVFLIAPRVENSGLIDAPAGQVGLAAGTEVTLAYSSPDDLSRTGYYILIHDDFSKPRNSDSTFGMAVNQGGGILRADGGIAGMYGNRVEHLGVIRSVTAFKNNRGQVELRAANKVTTGENSSISLPVDTSIDPETGKIVTVDDTFDIQPIVDFGGLHRFSGNSILDGPSPVRIEHRGAIKAPAGVVAMAASGGILLETGSRIDVSGVDVELPAPVLTSKLNTVELRDAYGQKGGVLQGETITTSITAGSSIGDLSQVILTQPRTALERSIGGARRTFVDQATGIITYNNPQTGEIRLTADEDLVVKQGAILDFSGGSARYEGGAYDTTKLVSGSKIYDISSAPPSIYYDKVMGEYTKTYERFGVREKYSGLYYGGASSIKTSAGGYTVGGDAGALTLSASRIVLNGVLDGGVTQGDFQNTWTMKGSFSAGSDYDLAMALSVRRGLETPRAGTLTVDTQGVTDGKGRESSISILSGTTPQADILSDPAGLTTVLSAETLNAASLNTLNLKANLTISSAPDAGIRLQPGGSFSATARRIDHQGKVTVPGGVISLITGQNQTSKKDPSGADTPPGYRIDMAGREEIVLGPGSVLDVSGERIDNSLAGSTANLLPRSGQTTGGVIKVMDQTDEGSGVTIKTDALVDVSGGYTIDPKGKVTGGNAGLLDIQGSKIVLDGELRGYALSDPNGRLLGGSVTLRSTNIHVAPEFYESPGTFVLAGDRFENTGFTQIALYSFNDVVIEPDTTIRTSLVRLSNPVAGREAGSAGTASGGIGAAVPGRPDLMLLNDSAAYMAGPSSFTALAGRVFEPIQPGAESKFEGHLKQVEPLSRAKVLVSEGAVIRTSPAVSGVTRIANDVAQGPGSARTGISLRGPNVEIRGTLESPGGDISVQSTSAEANYGNLTITAGAKIIAQGYNRPDPDSTPRGYPVNYLPVAGGKVTLSAYSDLVLAERSLIDISGSNAVENRVRTSDGAVFTFREAGDPGSLSLSFGGNLTSSGILQVKNTTTGIEGIKGGTLTVNRTRSVLQVGAGPGEVDLPHFIEAGFDDITLKGPSIQFNGLIDPAAGQIGRKLTLDSQIINGTGKNVTLNAPWIVLTNSQAPGQAGGVAAATGGGLNLSSQGWMDVIGSVKIGGFEDVTLQAKRDISVSERLPSTPVKEGELTVKGNLTLDADRVYPGIYYGSDASGTKYSDFTVSAGKKITIQHSSESTGGPIYSAGGSLTVEGKEGIEVREGGYLAAPMGTINLKAPGKRIYLADGSVLSTAGSPEIPVKYGLVDDGNLWKIEYTTPVDRDQLPSNRISLNADTVIVREGAKIDVSGGGSVFAYRFQPGIAGSKDPLTKANRYLVFKDNSFQLPGTQVYLKGGGGLSEGYYTLLPLNEQNARYAFMDQAYIIEVQKGEALPVSGKVAFTKEGYPLTAGYQTVADTSIQAARPQVFSVRKAADVLKMEGDYVKPSMTMGDAGRIEIAGTTAILEGQLNASAIKGYSGGTVSLSAANIIVEQTVGNLLPADFHFETPVGPELQNKLILSADALSGKGFREVSLGNANTTDSVTVESGSILEAGVISLSARNTSLPGGQANITINDNAELRALTDKNGDSGDGVINLATKGRLAVNSGALIHATHEIKLEVNDVDGIEGKLQVDSSAITLASEKVFFFDRGTSIASGLYVTNEVLSRFSGFENITFMGNDIQFMGAMALSAAGSLTLDAAGILDMKPDGGSAVTLTAPAVHIKNSAGAISNTAVPAGITGGTFTVNAGDRINIGGGGRVLRRLSDDQP